MDDSLQAVVSDSLAVVQDAASVLTTTGLSSSEYAEAKRILLDKAIEWGTALGSKILIAILIYVIGSWVVKHLNKLVSKIMEKREVEASLASFVKSLVKVVLNFILILIIIGTIGVETSSFVALFASAGVAIGMALSGTLQNFAGGVMILLFKPFKVGDLIEGQGQTGVVKEIQIFNTILSTVDNKTIIVPNGVLSTGTTINYSKQPLRRVDLTYGIAYGDSYDKAKSVLMEIINADDRVLKTAGNEPFVGLVNLGESSVDLTVRLWVESANYWDVFFAMNEKVYKTFSERGINIPFPQMDVHCYTEK